VRVVQRCDGSGLAGEALEAHRVARDLGMEHLQGDVPAESRVVGAIDFAHAARAELSEHFVRADPGPGRQGHSRPAILE
jgi:hypothetical protein